MVQRVDYRAQRTRTRSTTFKQNIKAERTSTISSETSIYPNVLAMVTTAWRWIQGAKSGFSTSSRWREANGTTLKTSPAKAKKMQIGRALKEALTRTERKCGGEEIISRLFTTKTTPIRHCDFAPLTVKLSAKDVIGRQKENAQDAREISKQRKERALALNLHRLEPEKSAILTVETRSFTKDDPSIKERRQVM